MLRLLPVKQVIAIVNVFGGKSARGAQARTDRGLRNLRGERLQPSKELPGRIPGQRILQRIPAESGNHALGGRSARGRSCANYRGSGSPGTQGGRGKIRFF